MGNQHLYNLTNESYQILISGKLGDGCFVENKNEKSSFRTNCIYKEYIDFKGAFLAKDFNTSYSNKINRGYKANMIFNLATYLDERIYKIHKSSIENTIKNLDDFGLALWFYDDGTRHKDKNFYQLSTHSFTKEIQEDLFIPLLKDKWGIIAKCIIERKKDGREFWYLNISKYKGSYEISNLLLKIPLKCFEYKLWSSTTIHLWSKFQEELKNKDITNIDPNNLSRIYLNLWRKVSKQ